MASVLVALVLAALAIKKGKASPTESHPSCVELEVPVTIDTTVPKWQQLHVDSSIDAVSWAKYETTRTSPNTTESIIGTIHIQGTFKISGKLCVPQKHSNRSDILQIATHGAGFGQKYWDVELNPNQYSYVNAAVSEGYSIFIYDRLGIGLSDKPDAYTHVQTKTHVEILRQLTSLFRDGKLVAQSKSLTKPIPPHITTYKPTSIIHVGHSLGSLVTLGLITNYPSASNGVILTGIIPQSIPVPGPGITTFGFEFARENDPIAFADRGSGYIVQATKYNVQLIFLHQETLDPAMLDYAFKIRQSGCVSELKSLLTSTGKDGDKFKGPVQFFIGEYDYGNCGGDCKGAYDLEKIKKMYPAAKKVEAYLQPGTGHGLTLSKNATEGYKIMFDFLHRSGF